MIYDCIPFFNELDILKLRLHTLSPYVDRFVIEEATVTFSGEPKELCFEKNKELFIDFLPKIDYIIVDDSPQAATTHERDKYQKNNLIKGLNKLNENDIIIFSDVDEIPDPAVLQKIIAGFDPDKIYHLAQRMFYCYLNMEEISGSLLSITGEFAGVEKKQWLGTKIFSVKNLPDSGIVDIREADPDNECSIRVPDGGWHFGYMGGKGEKDVSRRIGVKVQAAAHQEYNSRDFLAEAQDKLILGQDIFGRAAEFIRVEIDDSFPAYLRENQEEYAHLIMPHIGKGKTGFTKAAMKVKRFTRKAIRKSGRIYTKAAEQFKLSIMAAGILMGFIISLLPEFYLSFINRAAGDDYGYGSLTRQAWVDSCSLLEVIKAAGRTVRQYYYGWQGTWLSVFLFGFHPEVFHEKAYFVVTILALAMWIGVTALVLHYFLVRKAGFTKSGFVAISFLFLLIQIQFIPGTKSSLFWYNGIIHYLLPYTLCLLLVYLLDSFANYKDGSFGWGCFTGILLLMAILGGASYQAALFAPIITVCYIAAEYWKQKRKTIFLLFLPLSVQILGLIISMKAPGNQVRGGQDFGFSLAKAAETIGRSLVEGCRQIGVYLTEKPLAMIGLILMAVTVFYVWSRTEAKHRYPYPGLVAVTSFGIYCALWAPELYAGTDVSRGVDNIYFQAFVMMVLIISCYTGGWLKYQGRLRELPISRSVVPALAVCLLLTGVFRSNIKDTTFWQCLDYIVSGQAGDYREQMNIQTAVLLDEDVKDVVIPFINDVQGPLMHMPATGDETAWTNTVMKEFYGKDSVIAIDRGIWNEKYGRN